MDGNAREGRGRVKWRIPCQTLALVGRSVETLRRPDTFHFHSRNGGRAFQLVKIYMPSQEAMKICSVYRNSKYHCKWKVKRWTWKEISNLDILSLTTGQRKHTWKKIIIITLGYKPNHIKLLPKIKMQSATLESLLIIRMKTKQSH